MGSQTSKPAEVGYTKSDKMGSVLRGQECSGEHEKSNVQLLREPQGLSVSTLKSWQSTLLDDPKNKSVYPISGCYTVSK